MGAAATESPAPIRVLGFAFAAGFVALVAGGGALALTYEARPLRAAGLSAGLWGALLLLALRAPLEALATRILGPRGRVAWWLAMSVGAVALGLSTAADVHYNLHSSWRLSYGDPRLWECEPWAVGVAVVTTMAAACWAFAPFPSRRGLRQVGVLVAVLAAALFVGAGARAARAPAIDRYVATLPIIDQVPALPGDQTPNTIAGVSTRSSDTRVAGTRLTLRRYTFDDGGGCALRLDDDASTLPARVLRRDENLMGCGALTLRSEGRRRALLVTSASAWSSQSRAFDLDSGAQWADDRAVLATFAESMSTPRSWIAAALVALALGLLAALSKRETHWWSSRDRWRQGTLGADGVIALDGDGGRVTVPFGVGLTAGPVVLRGYEARSDEGPFRAGPSVGAVAREDARGGTLVSVAAELEALTDARLAYVLFVGLVVVATLAPMWAVGLAP